MAAYRPVITGANRIILAIGFAYGAVVLACLVYRIVRNVVASNKGREQFKARVSEGIPFVEVVNQFKAKNGAWPESSSDCKMVAGESLPKGWTYVSEMKDIAGNIYPPVLALTLSSEHGRASLEYDFGNNSGWYFTERGTREPMEIGKSPLEEVGN